jgi:hypothetical protein
MAHEHLGPEGIRAWYERKKEERREYVLRRQQNWRDQLGRFSINRDTRFRERLPGQPTRKERRSRPSTGTNQPRPIRVVKFDGEPCKWPQMAHVKMERVTRRCLRA